MNKPVASLKGAVALKPEEAALVESVALTRPKGFWARFRHGMAMATKVVERSEFDRVCLQVVKDLDGQALSPVDAAERAERVVAAYTLAEAGCRVCKCDVSDHAVIVIWLGHPHAGFLFQRHLVLKDMKAAKNGR